jgi:hypothetical protein
MYLLIYTQAAGENMMDEMMAQFEALGEKEVNK